MTDTTISPDQARSQILAQIVGRSAEENATRETELQLRVLQLQAQLEDGNQIIASLTQERVAHQARIAELVEQVDERVEDLPQAGTKDD